MKTTFKIILFIVTILILVQTIVLAQNPKSQIPNPNSKFDSLKLLLKTAKHDTIKLRILIELSEECDPTDILKYAQPATELADKLLQNKYSTVKQSSIKKQKAIAINNIGYIYMFQGDIPKALKYYNKSLKIQEEIGDKQGIATSFNNIGSIYDNHGDIPKALEYYGKSLKIQEEIGDKKGMAYSFNNIGSVYQDQGTYDKALEYNSKSLKIREVIGDKKEMATSLNNIGVIYKIQGNIPKALEYFGKSVKIQEKIGDKREIATSYMSIGQNYNDQGDIPKALEYFSKSLKIYEEIGYKQGVTFSFNDIAALYNNQGDIPKALEYFGKSLKIQEEIGNKKGMANSFNNIGFVYYNQGDIPKALEYFGKSLKMQEEIGDKKGMASSFNNIGGIYKKQGNFTKALEFGFKSLKIEEEIGNKQGMTTSFNNIGGIYLKRNNIVEANKIAEKSYKISKELGYPREIKDAAYLLKKVNEKQGDYKKAFEYYQEEILMRDSINNKENFKKTQKQQSKYEYEKRAATDSIAHIKAIEIKNLEVKKQKTVIGFTAFGLLLILVIAVIIFRSLRITRKQKKIIENQKHLVDEKNVLLNQQKEEIEVQRDTVTQQKEHIEEIYHEISDSINYAKRIQQAVLPTGDYADNILGNHFILFRPKDVVSGDFYWATKVNEYLIITVADCTGHGVPGAFMSMLGISFLNEIVRKKEVTQAAHVLDQLRESVIDALKQKGQYGEQMDGMDMVLIAINTVTFDCQFSGANNPLWIVRNANELEEVKPDKMPVAFYENMNPFTNNVIQLQKSDTLYLASDGYEDQFGGPKRKKFLSKNMKELIRSNSNKPMNEQKEILETTIIEWIGTGEQIDDITVMGIKI